MYFTHGHTRRRRRRLRSHLMDRMQPTSKLLPPMLHLFARPKRHKYVEDLMFLFIVEWRQSVGKTSRRANTRRTVSTQACRMGSSMETRTEHFRVVAAVRKTKDTSVHGTARSNHTYYFKRSARNFEKQPALLMVHKILDFSVHSHPASHLESMKKV